MTTNREQWFYNHIGHTIFRPKGDCDCDTCQSIYKHGLTIIDHEHAHSVYIAELETSGLHYFESEKERDNFERNLE